MKEIELKVLDVDEKEIVNKIIGNNAKKVADELIHEKYYDFNDDRLAKSNELFRLRKAGNKMEISYKKRRSEEKGFLVFDEFETNVDNFDSMEKIIENLGFKCIVDREKKRATFTLMS